MKKKFELTGESIHRYGKKAYRIKALKDFNDIKAGDLGGFIESESNLSQEGNAWVAENACVIDNARIYDDAWVGGNAIILEKAAVYNNTYVCGKTFIYGSSCIYGNAAIYGNASVGDNTRVYGNAKIYGCADICGVAKISGNARIYTDDDYFNIKGLGIKHCTTTFFKDIDGIYVVSNDFEGTLENFIKHVNLCYKNTKYINEYLLAIKLAKAHFTEENKNINSNSKMT